MGLSIHYTLETIGGRSIAEQRIAQLRERALTLPFEEVSDVLCWRGDDADAPPVIGDWLFRPAGGTGADDRRVSVPPIEVIVFTATCAGAEAATFGLASHPAAVTGATIDTGLATAGWRWQTSCKTQYAGLPMHGGFDPFLRAHGSIVTVLDEANRLGLVRDIVDESNYWTSRDVDALRAELDKWNRLIAAFTGRAKDVYGETGRHRWSAAITDDPAFEQMEAKGDEMLRRMEGGEE